jgi:hypothetical protein
MNLASWQRHRIIYVWVGVRTPDTALIHIKLKESCNIIL